jgi:uncharacterized protein
VPTPILFLHSAGPQGPGEGSTPLLASLRKALSPQYELRAPPMPRPEDPSYVLWRPAAVAALAELESGAVVIGHSLGGSVLLKLLDEEGLSSRPGALFLVATPFWGLPGWDYEEFALRPGFGERLPPGLPVTIVLAEGDDVVREEHAERYAAEIPRAALLRIADQDHLFARCECAPLVEAIRSAAARA